MANANPSTRAPGIVSIRWIVTSAAAALTAITLLGLGLMAERSARAALTAEIQARLVLQARNLALTSADALLGEFPELTLHPLTRQMVTRQPELAFALVVDHRGAMQGHPDAGRLGEPYQDPEALAAIPAVEGLEPGESLATGPTLLVAAAPVRHASGQVIGTARVALPRVTIERALASQRRQQALVLAGFVLLAVVSTFLLMSQLLRPVATLRRGLERITGGDLATPIVLRDRTELGLLAHQLNDMAAAILRAQKDLVERERLAREVELAREIQGSLLPSEPLRLPDFVLQGDHRSATEVGGDYYDLLRLPDGRIGLAIADVAGKGLGGCLQMMMLSALLKALRYEHTSPSALLAALDERLTESLRPGEFVTMFYGVLDPIAGRLCYASAGHNPLVVYRRSSASIERRATAGIPLGALRGGAIRSTLADHTLELGPGDLLVQYTDGYTEAFGRDATEQFGLDRLERVVLDAASRGPEAVVGELRQSLREWAGDGPPLDDETLLVVACVGREAAPSGADPRAGSDDRGALFGLAEAERAGSRLSLPARLDLLPTIEEWMRRDPVLGRLPEGESGLLRTALYEVCANISEHGYRGDATRSFDLWWIPPSGDGWHIPPADPVAGAAWACRMARRGRFLIRDQGTPFTSKQWKESDFTDPAVWKRGRGLGLDILHRVMREVAYHPATGAGNVTVLTFGPRDVPTEKGVRP